MVIFLLLVCAFSAPPLTPVYYTDTGPVRGLNPGGIYIFHGIPFAAPPVGNFRLKSPQPVTPWNQTLDCVQPPPKCSQDDVTTGIGEGKEDCLYLNVYVSCPTCTEPRPVFFWVYGGGFVAGDSWEGGAFDGQNISMTHNYIVVTHNYRLGALGFLSLDQLKNEDPYASTGNYGLQDQVAALQWVQRNIHVFGGDPNQVTIFGESAGAFSVCWHLVSQASKGLFRAAIMESGTCDSGMFFVRYDRATSWSKLYAKSKGCDPDNSTDVLGCLRSLSATDINHVPKDFYSETGYWLPLLYPVMPWGPVIDGSSRGLLDLPLTLLQTGKGNYVPHIAGINQNEGSIFIPMARALVPSITHEPLTEDDLVILLGHFFCNNQTTINSILSMYPLANYKGVDHQAAMILRDFFFGCPTKRALRAEAQVNPRNPFFYEFTFAINEEINKVFGDYHGSEVCFVWNYPFKNWTDTDSKMAGVFGSYWSNLVHNLTPNGAELVPSWWPNYAEPNPVNIMLDVPTKNETNFIVSECQLWDSLMSQCAQCGC